MVGKGNSPPGERNVGRAPSKEGSRPGPVVMGKRIRPRPAPEGRSRVTFDFAADALDALERVRMKSGSNSSNEAIRRALTAFERHLDEVALGSRPVYERPDGSKVEIIIF